MKHLSHLVILTLAITGGWLAHGFLQLQPTHKVTKESSDTPPETQLDFKDARLEICHSLAEILAAGDSKLIHFQATQLLVSRPGDEPIWKALFLRWFDIDPDSAWDFVSMEVDQNVNPAIITLAISQWAALDPRATHGALTNPNPGQLRALIKGAMKSDPNFAFTLLDDTGLLTNSRFNLDGSLPWEKWIFELSQSNPGKLDSWLRNHDKDKNHDLSGAWLAGLAVNNQAAAFAWLRQQEDQERLLVQLGNFVGFGGEYSPALMDFASAAIPVGDRRLEVLHYALEELASHDPHRAVSETRRLFTDPSHQAEILAKIAEELRRSDFQTAWTIAQQIDPEVLKISRVAIPDVVVFQDGLTENHPKPFRYQWSLTSMRGLVEPAVLKSQMLADLFMVDRAAALDYLKTLPPDHVIPVAGRGAIEQWIRYEPGEALTWLAHALPKEVDSQNLNLLLEQSHLTPDQAKRHLQEIPTGSLRSALTDMIADEFAYSSPKMAIDFLRREGGSERGLDWAYHDWASVEPKEALQAIVEDKQANPEMWQTVIAKSFLADPDHAIKAIETLPAGEARDRSFLAVAGIYEKNSDPLAATEWTLGIDDVKIREKSFDSILKKVSMDLRMTRDSDLKNELSNMITSEPNLSENQKSQWLQRLETEFTDP